MRAKTSDVVVNTFAQAVRGVLGDKLVAIYWFGSRANNKGNADSDYDLLLETRETLTDAQRDRVLDITIHITAEHGCLLDVHYYTVAELHQRPVCNTPFIQNVMKEGFPV